MSTKWLLPLLWLYSHQIFMGINVQAFPVDDLDVRQDSSVCARFPTAGRVNPGQTNVYPCDTSYIRKNFPCSSGDDTKTQPCLGDQLKPWTSIYMGPDTTSSQPKAKKPATFKTNFQEPTILSVTDTLNQAEHFLVKANGEFVGETGFETGYSNLNTCGYNTECARTSGYSHGYFLLPAGMY